jgi:hypothetical protein
MLGPKRLVGLAVAILALVGVSAASAQEGERKWIPVAVDSSGEPLDVVGVQSSLYQTFAIYSDAQGALCYAPFDAPEKGEGVPKVGTMTFPSGFGANGIVNLDIAEDLSVEKMVYWADGIWKEVPKATNVVAADPKRPLPPFGTVPPNLPTGIPCKGGWVYQESYWTPGGCLMDVWKCADTMNVVTTFACCFDSGGPDPIGPKCESFGLQ